MWKSPKLWLFVSMGISFCIACLYFIAARNPAAPSVAGVSECQEMASGVRRIGGPSGVQFDVVAANYSITEGTTDTIPVIHGFRLKPRTGASELDISFGQRPLQAIAPDPVHIFSKHVEERDILENRRIIGKDDWGYTNSGEQSREVQFFKGGIVARYQFVNKEEAAAFDQVINSACLVSSKK